MAANEAVVSKCIAKDPARRPLVVVLTDGRATGAHHSPMKLLIFAGSTRQQSYNRRLAAVAAGIARERGAEVTHLELADLDIKVNCVTPAAVKTAIFDQMSEQHIQFMLNKIPMGRFGTPEEIAAMVVWLCTEDCSFTTGAVFDLSGGRATY